MNPMTQPFATKVGLAGGNIVQKQNPHKVTGCTGLGVRKQVSPPTIVMYESSNAVTELL